MQKSGNFSQFFGRYKGTFCSDNAILISAAQICICVITKPLLILRISPEGFSAAMEFVGDIFASMGSFTAAFGMDRLN